MDRPLDAAVLRRAGLTRIAKVAIPALAVIMLIAWLPGFIRPSVSRQRVRMAKVTTGPIEAVITASGMVVPESERALSSPVDARVLRILKRPGDPLKAAIRSSSSTRACRCSPSTSSRRISR